MITRIFLSCLPIFFGYYAEAATYANDVTSPIRWKPLGEPGCGGWVVSLGANPHRPGEVLVGGDLLGVGISLDHGQRWAPTFGFRSVEMGDFTFHPSDPNIVWVGTMSGPYCSLDGGNTWQERRSGFPEISSGFYSAPVEKILFDPTDNQRLLAFGGNSRRYNEQPQSKYGSVWESRDGGNSWVEIATIPTVNPKTAAGANIVGVTFAAGSGDILYAAAELRGLMKSLDGGRTWTECNAGLPHKNIERVVAHPVKRNTLWICLNAWKPEGDGEAISGSVFRSDDGGKTFTELAGGLPNRTHANPLFAANYKAFDVSRTNPDVMVVSDCAWNGCKIFRSTDGGKNWESVLERRASDGAEKTINAAYFIGPAMTVLCIDPTDADIVYAAGAEYIARSTDGGKTWLDISSREVEGGWRGRGYCGLCSMNFRFDPFQRGRAILLAMDAGKCWETTDGMKSWNYHGQEPNPWGGGNDATFARDGLAYSTTGQFGSDAAILRCEKSDRKDAPWTPLCGADRGLPANEGGGVATGIYTLPDDSSQIWAVVAEQLYHSANSGDHWASLSGKTPGLPDLPCGWIAGDPRFPTRFYVSTKDAVFVTEDGMAFANIGGPCVAGRMTVDAKGQLYLAAYRGERPGLWRYKYKTDPRAGAWTRLKDDRHLSNVAVDPKNPDRILVTSNDDPYHDHVASLGVSISADGGKTWSDENAGLPVLRGHAVAFDPFEPEKIVFGTLGCGFFGARWPKSYQPTGPIRYENTQEDSAFAAPRKGAVSMLRNGAMSVKQQDGNAPDAWSDTWGDVTAVYDDRVFVKGPASLCVEPKEPGKSGQAFQMLDGHAGRKLRLLGFVKSFGNVKANVAVQAFDEKWTNNTFIQIKYLQGTIDWTRFDGEFTVPDWAARFNVQLMVDGAGRAWMDEVVLIPADEPYFEDVGGEPEGIDETVNRPPAPAKVEVPEAAIYKNPWTPTEGFFADYPHAWKQFHENFLEKIKERKPIDVVFFGDSITQGWNEQAFWKESLQPLGAVNFGIGGDRTQQILWRMENGELDGYAPKVVVVAIGINNTWDPSPGSAPEEVGRGMMAILAMIRKKQPEANVLIVGVLPSGEKADDDLRRRVKEINACYKKLADDKKIRFLDFGDKLLEADGSLSTETAPDFLHLSPKGYRIYRDALLPVLKKML